MRKMSVLIVMMIITLLTVLTISAQENNPSTNDDANACFEGGAIEGKCNNDMNGDGIITQDEVDWAWMCGWYLIRYNNGIYDRDAVPDTCQILLPSEIVSEATAIQFAFRSSSGSSSFGLAD